MAKNNKLMEMLTGYAAAHQHPFNVFVHMIGIPAIMLGSLIPMGWVSWELFGVSISMAHLLIVGFSLFYVSLDVLFAAVFAVGAFLLTLLAERLAPTSSSAGWQLAALLFFGGYAAQFVGHAVEKSMPVLVKHPIQANLAAPFFTVVELFKIAGLRGDLFAAVQQEIAARRAAKEA